MKSKWLNEFFDISVATQSIHEGDKKNKINKKNECKYKINFTYASFLMIYFKNIIICNRYLYLFLFSPP